jgi:hypothetical protein
VRGSPRGAVPAGIIALEAPAPLHGDIMVEYWDPWLGSGVRSKHPNKLSVLVIILVIERIVRSGRIWEVIAETCTIVFCSLLIFDGISFIVYLFGSLSFRGNESAFIVRNPPSCCGNTVTLIAFFSSWQTPGPTLVPDGGFNKNPRSW